MFSLEITFESIKEVESMSEEFVVAIEGKEKEKKEMKNK
jgi:hypothetical protein